MLFGCSAIAASLSWQEIRHCPIGLFGADNYAGVSHTATMLHCAQHQAIETAFAVQYVLQIRMFNLTRSMSVTSQITVSIMK